MVAHGFSHACATFVGALTASVLAEIIVKHFNVVDRAIAEYMLPFSGYLGLHLTEWQIIQILVLLIVGFVWGVAFKWVKGC